MNTSSKNSNLGLSESVNLPNPITELTQQERHRQKNTLNLIASENYPSKKVLELVGSVWSNKYGEGYPGKRYYAGSQFVDTLESFVQQKALEVFDTAARLGSSKKSFENSEELEVNQVDLPEKLESKVAESVISEQNLTPVSNQSPKWNFNPEFLGSTADYAVNVQVLSGSPANAMVFLSVLEYGDTILSLTLANGGHLSHLHATSNWNKFFKLVNYDIKSVGAVENLEAHANTKINEAKNSPLENKAIHIIGVFSDSDKYSRLDDWATMIETADQKGFSKIVLHLIADGLDTDKKLVEVWQEFVEKYTEKFKLLENKLFLGSLVGRNFAMSQEKNRIKESLEVMFQIRNLTYQSHYDKLFPVSQFFSAENVVQETPDFSNYEYSQVKKFYIPYFGGQKSQFDKMINEISFEDDIEKLVKITEINSAGGVLSDSDLRPIAFDSAGFREYDDVFSIEPSQTIYLLNHNSTDLDKFTEMLFDINREFKLNLNILTNFKSQIEGVEYIKVAGFKDFDDQKIKQSIDNLENNNHLCYEIDEADFEAKLVEFKPKLTILGASSYPRLINFAKLIEIAHRHGSLVLADVAHINGLIATGLHPSPFHGGASGADFVTMTTHKTLRGPRGAMIFMRKAFEKSINKTIFPGTSGGPHFNKMAAIGQCCLEILGEDLYPDGISFGQYSQNVLDTCKALENSLARQGLEIISPTQNHLCLIKLPDGVDSLEIQQKLQIIGIICNRNVLPNDTKSAWRPGGLRLGTAALVSRGLTVEMAIWLGRIIADTIFDRKTEEDLKLEVQNLVQKLNWWY